MHYVSRQKGGQDKGVGGNVGKVFFWFMSDGMRTLKVKIIINQFPYMVSITKTIYRASGPLVDSHNGRIMTWGC